MQVEKMKIIGSDTENAAELIRSHLAGLSFPMDSWLEEMLLQAGISKLIYDGEEVGYLGMVEGTLHFFHVQKNHFWLAADALEWVVQKDKISRVFVMTQDPLLTALMAEWDYEKEKKSCCFSDGKRIDLTPDGRVFRNAGLKDLQGIKEEAGDFFDEASGGFSSLEERIEGGTIFLLTREEEILGFGIIEPGRLFADCVSIGMFTPRKHRGQGVARAVLSCLKEWAYCRNLKPVAGCWYYNTLSRKSLVSAGMVATSMGYTARLAGREKPPLLTGNPPGEPAG